MKETEFQGWVIDCAKRFGWRCWHVPTPMRPIGGNKFVPESRAKGLPDLILLHDDPPRMILAELKNETGELSDEQREFLRLARDVAARSRDITTLPGRGRSDRVIGVYVWRPGVEDLIEAILRGKVMT